MAENQPNPDTKGRDTAVAAAELAKKLAEAKKAASDAQKAASDATLAALKARIGEVPASGVSGTVTIGTGAASMETALLAAVAARAAAKTLAERIEKHVEGKTLFIYPASEVPKIQAISAFRTLRSYVERTLDDAISDSDAARAAPSEDKTEAVPLAGAGLALDAMSKLLGFFRSDYTVTGSDLAPDDNLLMHAAAEAVLAPAKKSSVYLPGLYAPEALAGETPSVLRSVEQIAARRAEAARRISLHDRWVAELKQASDAITGDSDDEKKKRQQSSNAMQAHKDAGDKLKAAIGAYDTHIGKLATPDDKGATPLAAITREQILWDILGRTDALLLLVKMNKAGGSQYTKKNLWTVLFPVMPFFVMGGMVASYSLFEGKSGAVLSSGVIPVHGGFHSVTCVEAHIAGRIPGPSGERTC